MESMPSDVGQMMRVGSQNNNFNGLSEQYHRVQPATSVWEYSWFFGLVALIFPVATFVVLRRSNAALEVQAASGDVHMLSPGEE